MKRKPCCYCLRNHSTVTQDYIGRYLVECIHCGAKGPLTNSRVAALKAWNEGIE